MQRSKHVSGRGASDEAALVKFNFHGDELDVVSHDGEHYAVLSRLCEPLGLAPNNQIEKLKALPWACSMKIISHDASGRKQELFCLSLRSVAGWLFTINAGKIAPHLRDKLALYQRECADVLADHFLGRRAANDAIPLDLLRELSAQLTAANAANSALAADVTELRAQVHALALGTGTISGIQADGLASEIDVIARMRVDQGKNPSLRSAKSWIQGQLSRAVEWGGSGAARRFMPSDRYGKARALLAAFKADLESDARRNRRVHAERSISMIKSVLRQETLPFYKKAN